MKMDRSSALGNTVALVEQGSRCGYIMKLIAPVGALLQVGVKAETGAVVELDLEAHCLWPDPLSLGLFF